MKSKLVTVLVVILLVLVLLIGGALGFLWYRNNHIFVEGAAYPLKAQSLDLREEDISFGHYEAVHSQLPECEILWNVPFQGGKYSSDSQSLAVSTLTEEDTAVLLKYFPGLKKLDASACEDYAVLEQLQAQKPECEVIYQVSLGGKSFDPDSAELVLENGDYEFVTMMANLIHLPKVTSIQLRMPELTMEQVEELRSAYETIEISCTVEILGREYDNRVTELDLRDLSSEEVPAVAEKLAMLPAVTYVELSPEEGVSQLTKADVKLLNEALPEAVFHYTFDFYGEILSTTDAEVLIRNKKIGEDGVDEVRAVLDIMETCDRFVLEYCQISDETMAQLREEYRDKTKVVWRVFFGKGSSMTDAEILRAVYDLVDDNCHDLVYLEDVRYMDIGHNEWLDACEFVAGMPNLEYVIISGAPIKDLTPFQNCKKLKVLEAAFCEYIESVEPLAGCESLERLNISYTHVTDLSPLDNLNLVNLCAMYAPKSRVPQEEQERWLALKPDCQTNFVGSQPYGSVWRYDDNNDPLEWYANIREVFKYDIYPNTPNHVGWYLPEGFEGPEGAASE